MAKVLPFSGLFYRQPEYKQFLAPPYDVISPQEREILLARSQYNIVRLVLPESPKQANRDFQRWLDSSVFIQDREPCFYWCRQDYRFNGKPCQGEGLIALLGLEEWKKGWVYPHEETIPIVRREQLEILKEVKANFCPIILIYRDEERIVETMAAEAEKDPPFLVYEDDRQVKFSLWRIRNTSKLTEFFESRKVFIADGHHRYSSALEYFQQEKRPSSAFVLAYFLNALSGQKRVLPFHRYLPDVTDQEFISLSDHFELKPEPNLQSLFDHLSEGWIGGAVDKVLFRFVVPERGQLEVFFLHKFVINNLLQKNDDQVLFDPEAERVYQKLKEKGGAVFFLPSLLMRRIQEVWEKGIILPRKSTYFYPKIPSGLVIYRHE